MWMNVGSNGGGGVYIDGAGAKDEIVLQGIDGEEDAHVTM
jgi:hypothetical protein